MQRRHTRPPEQPRQPRTRRALRRLAWQPSRCASRVISDIHSNLPALEAVLADVDREAPDELWCLGDIVGYGPHPNECVDLTRDAHSSVAVRQPRPGGARHDRHRRLHRRRGRGGALDDAVSSGSRQAAWLRELSPAAERAGCRAVPRQPAGPVWDYVLSEQVALDQHPRDDGADRARRPQPRGARGSAGTAPELSGGSAPERHRDRPRAPGAGS